LQFGPFELRQDTGELRKHGVRVRIQAKPLAILRALLEEPGEVVTRNELRDHLWPADTFVDFESGLNTAANRLRFRLGDSANTPRFVETLPRVGYRFIAPVVVVDGLGNTPTPAPGGANLAVVGKVATMEAAPPAVAPASSTPRENGGWIRTKAAAYTVVGIALALLAAAGVYLRYGRPGRHTPVFHQLTFQTGWIGAARFVPGGDSVVYAREAQGHGQLLLVNTNSPESRPLDFQRAGLLAVSGTGELAILTWGPSGFPMDHAALALVPLNGGAQRVIGHGAYGADFAPDGETLATVQDGGRVIEYAGKALCRSAGMVSAMRVSPSGDRIAFLDHPMRDDDAGVVRVVDMKGNVHTLTRRWSSVRGVAWSPSGREIWFTASEAGIDRALRAVTLDGHDRLISSAPGVLRLLDIARNGSVLLARDDEQMTMAGRLPGDAAERDLTWFDGSHVEDISADGNLVLFTESGEASGAHYWVYVHNRKTNSTTRIGTGRALALSPDGTWALAIDPSEGKHLLLIPVGGGPAGRISGDGFQYQWAQFFPDGRSLLVAGAFPGRAPALFRQSLGGGKPEPLRAGGTYVDFDFSTLAPDGVHLAGLTSAGKCVVIALGSDDVRPCQTDPTLVPARWAADGLHLYMTSIASAPFRVVLADPATGRTEVVRTLNAQESGGLQWCAKLAITPDGEHYAYSLQRFVSQLFVVDGWA
jgi:DNA-binding winged helix-turn-helix (wHTH) protein/Tol biopolymer transport system component